jgi:hypothetical protein
MTVAKDARSLGKIQSFSERRQYHRDLLGGGFQTLQGGVAPSSESGAAGRASKRLDLLSMTMLAIPNQGMNVSVCDAEVRALVVGTGEALGVRAFRGSPPAFDLAPGAYRQRRWPHTH